MDNTQFQTVDDHETNDNDDPNIVKQNKNLVVDDSWTENESVNETQFKSCQNKEETGSECLDQYIIEEKVNKDDSWNEKDSTKDKNEIAESEDLRSNNDWNESVNDTQFKSLNEDERHENNDYPIDNDLEQNNSNGNDNNKDIDDSTNVCWSENESVNRTQFKSIAEDVTHENDNSFSQNIENDLELDNSNDKDNRKEIDEPTNDDWPENDSVNGTQFKSLNEDGTHENNDYFTDQNAGNDHEEDKSKENDDIKEIAEPTNNSWSENESFNGTQFKSINEDIIHENNNYSTDQHDLQQDNSNGNNNNKEIDEPSNDDWSENDSIKSLNEVVSHENSDYPNENDLEQDISEENDDIKEIGDPPNGDWSENETVNNTQFESMNDTGQVEVDESRDQEKKGYDNGQGNIFNIS